MTKKQLNGVFVATFICGILTTMMSCSDCEEQAGDSLAMPKTHRITAEQAKQNALDFVGQFDSTTRAFGGDLTVSEVKAISCPKGDTRSIADAVSLDSLFYVVNFDNDRGFVLAASDDRETPVYAYVEDGKFDEDEVPNNGYDAFVNTLIENETIRRIEDRERLKTDEEQGGGNNGNSSANLPDKFEVMRPLLNTKWDQEGYIIFCPGPYTGCVPTAISQICSYLRFPEHIEWSDNGVACQRSINWVDIVAECGANYGNPYSKELTYQIANLMRYWGVMFNAEYGAGDTFVSEGYAIKKMKELGYNATGMSDYNAINVMNDLKKGNRIIYMEGSGRYYHIYIFKRKYVDGHAWVVDGYIHSRKNNEESIYVHCNWGWGGRHNGYFLSDVLNADEGPCYDDNANLITRNISNNFRYKLKTSTICK